MSRLDDPRSAAGANLARMLGLFLLFAVLHAVFVLLGYLCKFPDLNVSTFWPSTGFAMAVLLMAPRQRWPAILVVMLFVETLVAGLVEPSAAGSAWWEFDGIAARIVNALEAALGAALLRWQFGDRLPDWGLRPAITIVCVGVVVTALGGMAMAPIVVSVDKDALLRVVFKKWFFSDGIGLLLMVPLVVAWANVFCRRMSIPRWPELVEPTACLLATLFAAQYVFGADWLPEISVLEHPYLLAPFFIWAGLRLQPRVVALVLASTAVVLVLNAQERHGPFVQEGQPTESLVLEIQAFLAVMVSSTLILSAVVTDRKRAYGELVRLAHKMAHVSRLSTMGELVAQIAHEVNQPLYSILNYSKACRNLLAREDDLDVEQLREWNAEIGAAATTAGDVIKRLRDFGGPAEFDPQPHDANSIVTGARDFMDFALRKFGVRVDLDLSRGLPRVVVDRVQIHQVLVNLLQNACEAMEGSDATDRCITVRTKQLSDRVAVTVSDNGPGLPEAGDVNLFDTFVTTKPQGMGLGLAISRTILENHGGRIWATKSEAGGAEFLFTLPTEKPYGSDNG
jgi:signal transduction histidine kinase